ncbi:MULTISPECIES: molybdate ABC transporter substrate-binding protein [unclassified Gilliamella]|uniref:molybdate ABC transporter substrate-binding protein n=1 Tax=unclassified Gilliamella TaxID=2685620 RepID=UPI000A5DBCE5|nr:MULTISPECIES: molybdate ABC transporter substrate-binding protein [Gilliamella]MCX8583385.1 molybdate ABC transporter substrate-binding protein [Gilliamella sp. B3372]MCX8593802.1 molybdate ABC transporter substrate-binding protein [Gilliamella sp. B3367]MCX8596174.1 molybdate ABC transporter substrate-binding protein [Gilliamella sp. B3493]MCX8598370.1 molybdate ABC transporter substrate-binding protein [Gilliamella sp. B3486]MCX8659413.1 molybdate ABC transporter substrate-binding protein
MRRIIGVSLFIVTLLVSLTTSATQKITVFAAASLTNAMQDIATSYKDAEIVFSFASSSVLAKQIEQGAPADIFMSADQKWMNYLIEHKVATDKQNLLKNGLVLIAPKQSKLEKVEINANTDWQAILPKGERLAVGDPDHVPAGLYAKESLTNLGVFDKLLPQMAPASNVRDALMLVERNEAALGIVYSTDAKVSDKVKIIGSFPAETFTPIEYPITLLKPEAKEFYQYLSSETAKKIFQKYGFITE